MITRKLLRKRSEHNEGMISTLEELTLHQEELEGINEVLGATCRKLKILYLQNNLIWRMENLQHLKDLEYLNLALNNISKVEGLQNCEFLNKLDLTVNFIDVDELEVSMDHLQGCERLRELYLMGNPCQSDWPGMVSYVVAKLPQLRSLDGTEVTKSMQISARQKLPLLEDELRHLAAAKREEKAKKALLAATAQPKSVPKKKSASRVEELDEQGNVICEDVEEDDEDDEEGGEEEDDGLTENTPEARQEIYRELAQQKKEKEDRENANKPRERDYDAEQAAAIEATRLKEEEAGEREVRQKNEGGWDFRWDEESRPGNIVLEVSVARHLDSSLIDVDVHPSYVSMVIKSKVLRLRTPAEVKAGESKCQRSKTTGALLVIMPKVNPRETTIAPAATIKAARTAQAERSRAGAAASKPVPAKKLSLQEQMMQLALAEQAAASAPSSEAVDVRNIVKKKGREEKEGAEGVVPSSVFTLETAQNQGQGKTLVSEID